jgi:hypothetical protein
MEYNQNNSLDILAFIINMDEDERLEHEEEFREMIEQELEAAAENEDYIPDD